MLAGRAVITDVATVSTKGVVTGVGTGTATITVTTADGGFTAKCTVTVTDPSKPALAADGYYEISNAAQLKWFTDEVNASKDNAALNARLTDDIDLSGICSSANPWTPIGDHANNRIYSGTFDGQGHKITGLYLKGNASNYTNGNTYYIGLFGECDGVTIKNLSVYGHGDGRDPHGRRSCRTHVRRFHTPPFHCRELPQLCDSHRLCDKR